MSTGVRPAGRKKGSTERPRRAGRCPGWWHRAIPPTSRRAYRTDTRGRSVAWSGAVSARAAHGRPHGRSGDRSTGWHSEGAGERAYPRVTPGIQRQKPTTDRCRRKRRQRISAVHEGQRRTSGIAGHSGSCLRGFRVHVMAELLDQPPDNGPCLRKHPADVYGLDDAAYLGIIACRAGVTVARDEEVAASRQAPARATSVRYGKAYEGHQRSLATSPTHRSGPGSGDVHRIPKLVTRPSCRVDPLPRCALG